MKRNWRNLWVQLKVKKKYYKADSLDDFIENRKNVKLGRDGIFVFCSGIYKVDNLVPFNRDDKEIYDENMNYIQVKKGKLEQNTAFKKISVIIEPTYLENNLDENVTGFSLINPYLYYSSKVIINRSPLTYSECVILSDYDKIYNFERS